LVDVPGGFGGIEYPGLVFIGTLGEVAIVDPTVHEVAHQWFYGLIGNDQLNQPWLDEGASRYSQVLYYENFVSVTRARSLVNYDRAQILGHQDATLPIGLQIDDYSSPGDYVLFVYSKGSLFFDTLRSVLGEEDFIEFLRTYFTEYRYGFATSEGFQTIAEEVCSCDLDEIFDRWVYKGGEISIEGN
jgi:aminopeptidase N